MVQTARRVEGGKIVKPGQPSNKRFKGPEGAGLPPKGTNSRRGGSPKHDSETPQP